MKKDELKKLIKPLVKECIHEVLLEEGLLSSIVSEVAKGMQGNLILEAPQKQSADLVNNDNDLHFSHYIITFHPNTSNSMRNSF